MLAKTHAAAVHGVDARTIEVEVNSGGEVAQGQPMYFLVGLPDNAIREGWQGFETSTERKPKCYLTDSQFFDYYALINMMSQTAISSKFPDYE